MLHPLEPDIEAKDLRAILAGKPLDVSAFVVADSRSLYVLRTAGWTVSYRYRFQNNVLLYLFSQSEADLYGPNMLALCTPELMVRAVALPAYRSIIDIIILASRLRFNLIISVRDSKDLALGGGYFMAFFLAGIGSGLHTIL